jgi:hypothetical protein
MGFLVWKATTRAQLSLENMARSSAGVPHELKEANQLILKSKRIPELKLLTAEVNKVVVGGHVDSFDLAADVVVVCRVEEVVDRGVEVVVGAKDELGLFFPVRLVDIFD